MFYFKYVQYCISKIFYIAATPVRKCDQKTEFDCGGGECIPISKVCDKKVDCTSAQDEPLGKCDIDECKVKNGGCEHICRDTPSSYYCECRHGYVFLLYIHINIV